MPLLSILIYNKIIKQTVKPAIHVQNMPGLNMLQFETIYVCSRINTIHESLKLSIGQSKQYKTC